ncbi:MAG TPA: type II toxin-antitoxin system HicA family toxin [Myxococcota bacterium]|nr:type II toxin-antitoxin system HicA family toxin [Myxococcota bacterium]HQP96049.1 type II toxin-antitoxin system HicA family toxin [Myxococcota bacterium]
MSPSLPVISGDEAVKILTKHGFRLVRQTGSHMIVRRDQPFSQLTVPRHKVLDRGTLRAIIRQSDLSVEAFIAAL